MSQRPPGRLPTCLTSNKLDSYTFCNLSVIPFNVVTRMIAVHQSRQLVDRSWISTVGEKGDNSGFWISNSDRW